MDQVADALRVGEAHVAHGNGGGRHLAAVEVVNTRDLGKKQYLSVRIFSIYIYLLRNQQWGTLFIWVKIVRMNTVNDSQVTEARRDFQRHKKRGFPWCKFCSGPSKKYIDIHKNISIELWHLFGSHF